MRDLVRGLHVLITVVPILAVVALTSTLPTYVSTSWAQGKTAEVSAPASSASAPREQSESAGFATEKIWGSIKGHPGWAGLVIALVIVIGGGWLLYLAATAGPNTGIPQLGPSFFFWLSMMYTALLLLMGVIYNLSVPDPKPTLVGGILPIAVPWFGAIGAVAISLEGVFLWNKQWDAKYNYWHIGRPLFGAVLGIIAFFIFVVIGAAAGTPPKFLDSAPGAAKEIPPLKDFIIYYVVAFLVGYREETFRELIKRATDLIFKPGTPAPAAPAVTFTIGGAPQQQISFPETAVGQHAAPITVAIQNSGNVPVQAPVVTLTPGAGTPANAFGIANDQVTGGGDLAPNQSRTVAVTFTAPPAADGGPDFTATLSAAATNLPQPTTVRVTGRRAA